MILLQAAGVLLVAAVTAAVLYLLWTLIRQRSRKLDLLEQRVEVARQEVRARHEALERERREEDLSWSGHRKFEVARKEVCCGDEMIRSFYLVPHDKRPLPSYEPGQFLTFELDVTKPDGTRDTVVRCYSLSDAPNPEYYRISVKRLLPPPDEDVPPGLASNHFHDEVEEDDILDVEAPSGQFYLERTHDRPVVLIGGGVGVTPMMSMLNHVVESGSKREVHFFHGVRNSDEQMEKEHLEQVALEHENIELYSCYSEPLESDVEGEDYFYEGWVSVELFKEVLPSNNYEYYVCGPPPMMKAIYSDLRDWGVPDKDIKFEAFGPASIKEDEEEHEPADVIFARSDVTCRWDDQSQTLLELAEENGVPMDFGCRVGNCNTCLTAVKDGAVDYVRDPNEMPDEGSCLTCIGVPDGDLVLDA